MRDQEKLFPFEHEVSIEERIKSFKHKFPRSHLCDVNGHLEGIWVIGNSARRAYSSNIYYGAYPHGYLNRVNSLFPEAVDILHLFSGSVNEDITLDVNPSGKPTVASSAELPPFRDNSFDLIISDPPYNDKAREKYGTEKFSRKKAVDQCRRIVKPGGFLVWLDVLYPQNSRDYWQVYGLIGLVVATFHVIRQITVLRRKV